LLPSNTFLITFPPRTSLLNRSFTNPLFDPTSERTVFLFVGQAPRIARTKAREEGVGEGEARRALRWDVETRRLR